MEAKIIRFPDATQVVPEVFPVAQGLGVNILILPALGVRASYYRILAQSLQSNGLQVFSVDYRGHGTSSQKVTPNVDFGYQQLVDDVSVTVQFLIDAYPQHRLLILGHSLGGQLASLFLGRYPDKVDGLILSASCSVYYKGWDGMRARQIQAAAYFIPWLSGLVGYFPGHRLGFGGKEARTVMRDWSQSALTGRYDLLKSSFDYEKAMQTLQLPVLALSYKGDNFASPRAVQNLYQKYHPDTPVRHLHLSGKDLSIPNLNHFNWAKHPDQLSRLILDWVQEFIPLPPIAEDLAK